MKLIKKLYIIFITILLLAKINITNANDLSHNENEKTNIELVCEKSCHNINNTAIYKILNYLADNTIINVPNASEEIKNRLASSIPIFTTITLYYILCLYLGIVPYDSLFYFASKLLLLDIFLSSTNYLIKPNKYLNIISSLYYIYSDIIFPVYINATMMSSFDIDIDIPSVFIVCSFLYSAFYSISLKANYRTNLLNKMLNETSYKRDEDVSTNKEDLFCQLIKNNNGLYLYNNKFTITNNELFKKTCNWVNDNNSVSLYNKKKEIEEYVISQLSKHKTQEAKNNCLSFLNSAGIILLSNDSEQPYHIEYIPNNNYKLLFKFKKQLSKITSSKLIDILQLEDAIHIEINNTEDPSIPDNYKYFTVIKEDKNYYILLNSNMLNKNYIVNYLLFFTDFSLEKINSLKTINNNDSSIIIKYNNRHQIREFLKIIIKVFKCNDINTNIYKINNMT